MILRTMALLVVLGVTGGPAYSQAPAAAPQVPAPPASAPPAAPVMDFPDAPSTTIQAKAPVIPTGPTAVIDTSMGRLTCKLYDTQAPITVANFIGLSNGTKEWTDPTTLAKVKGKAFYDGVIFHRVIPGFMIQGGDRLGTGTGDPGYLFQDEIDPDLTFDEPGRLAMANSGPSTNGSQFFVTEEPVPQLNGKHTIFGQCDAHSVLLVSSIARVERNDNDRPLTPVVIQHITIVRDGQPMPALPAVAPVAAPAASTDKATPASLGPRR
jgi:peptidyl-prolyl cis-trans isomerase A (cyclophilin A)